MASAKVKSTHRYGNENTILNDAIVNTVIDIIGKNNGYSRRYSNIGTVLMLRSRLKSMKITT